MKKIIFQDVKELDFGLFSPSFRIHNPFIKNMLNPIFDNTKINCPPERAFSPNTHVPIGAS